MSKTVLESDILELRTTADSDAGLHASPPRPSPRPWSPADDAQHPFGPQCPTDEVTCLPPLETVTHPPPFGGGRPTSLPKVSNFMSGSEVADSEVIDMNPPVKPKAKALDRSKSMDSRLENLRSTVGGRGIFNFQDADAIKDRIRHKLLKPEPYDVKDFYWEEGFWQRIARSSIFDNLTLAVIAFNAVWMAIDTDYNKSDSLMEADLVFIVGENFFCFYFSFEWLVRFMSFRRKCDGRKDAWFVFDTTLVVMMVFETWVFILIGDAMKGLPSGGILKLFRLLRLSRLMRMLRSLQELMILIKGMMSAMRSVLYVMALLILITYVFAIACTQLSAEYEFGEVYFKSVGLSMYSLIIYGTFLDALSDFCNAIKAESAMVLVLITIFVCLSALTVMNMLIGVLCEVISAVAVSEKEDMLTTSVRDTFIGVLEVLDQNSDQKVSWAEFKSMMDMPDALRALEKVGVDPIGMADFAETFFFDENMKPIEISFETFMKMVMDLRETNQATVKDIMTLWNNCRTQLNAGQKEIEELRQETKSLRETTGRIEGQLQVILNEIRGNGSVVASNVPTNPRSLS